MIGCNSPNRRDSGLNSLRPGGNGKIMRFVHDTKDDICVIRVLGRQGHPQSRKLVIGRTTLANDAAVPTGVVVDVEDALGARVETARHEGVVLAEIGRVQIAAHDIVGEVLPAHGNSKYVEVVVTGKVLHLGGARGGERGARHGACSVGRTAKVQARDIHASVGCISTGVATGGGGGVGDGRVGTSTRDGHGGRADGGRGGRAGEGACGPRRKGRQGCSGCRQSRREG